MKANTVLLDEEEGLELKKDGGPGIVVQTVTFLNGPVRKRHIVEAGSGMAGYEFGVRPMLNKRGFGAPGGLAGMFIGAAGGVAIGEGTLALIGLLRAKK